MGSSGGVGLRAISMLMTPSSTSPFLQPQWMPFRPFSAAGGCTEWMQENGLRLNPDKREVLRVSCPSIGGLGNSLSFGGVTLFVGKHSVLYGKFIMSLWWQSWAYSLCTPQEGSPNIVGGQLPSALADLADGEEWWKFQSNHIRRVVLCSSLW